MNRKPVFDAVRDLLGRGFTQAEVDALDAAIDFALAEPKRESEPEREAPPARRLGALSARFESGGRGPGTISSGRADPGGVSYGTYQLSSRAGTAAAFVASEGRPWSAELGRAAPGTPAFSAAWKAIADREPARFGAAQHAYIERTHYQPAITAVLRKTGLDLDMRHNAVRDATWSSAVQHGGAAGILSDAVARADALFGRADRLFDEALVEAIYALRSAYVERLAKRSSGATRKLLLSIVAERYPSERADALRMFDEKPGD
ncbi:hypothetical protein B2G71_14035 [Novosphingobium sp. PC22D]|uniref:VgrG-related protein n=1 Tax=Novosphingobium sp. PC22D TaxID=1962403 RepID=UPI000BF20A70|nr:hypothetical protein [Novosphingobium sp. PC22D]PEQ11902.1 hypothetical protein B2G71_14035 [Novosphingobium sp. PC22D]